MPQKAEFQRHQKNTPTTICPYECLHEDVLKFRGKGAQILACGDFNAWTAQEPDFVRTTALQSFVPYDEDLPDYIVPRRNYDSMLGTWGPELLMPTM